MQGKVQDDKVPAGAIVSQTAAYQLKITLADSEPGIWRRVIVASKTTLAELHRTIQQTMGWEDLHAYQFRLGIDQKHLLDPVETLAKVFASDTAPNQPLYYNYDAKSGWLHRIELETLAADAPQELSALPICIGGESACPPEGSGGVWGYDELLARLEDIEDPDYLELIDRYGSFDPDAFKVSEANARLSS
ncbi:plasmid pRiA4b ORF-3 family protein [cf. Phormidesmis sp. LEGE 11477]|uniref:plasmid pRiA4b ORF-3 family protein n=1 Tax=cf. Phormidesmis sp. LEGE 11477 TaxID=1828680 RepID=UPI001882FD8F|nr:plasmid pRiA4b ORF-3 family protein [cf. Phormidesmis sp. LEGE 11477]